MSTTTEFARVRRCGCGASVESADDEAKRVFGLAHLGCDAVAILERVGPGRVELDAYRGTSVVASAWQWDRRVRLGGQGWDVFTSDGAGGGMVDVAVGDRAQAEAILRMLVAAHNGGRRLERLER